MNLKSRVYEHVLLVPEGRDVSTSETNLKNGVDEEAKRNLAQLCCLFLILSQGAQPEERQENLLMEHRFALTCDNSGMPCIYDVLGIQSGWCSATLWHWAA